MLLPALAATACLALGLGSVAAQDDDETMEPAAQGSMAPVATLEPAALGPGIHVVNPWTRESPMMELAGAAFMTIVNNTDADDALVGASSPAAAAVEIHQTTEAEDGTMMMAPVAEVPIPAGGMAELKPGGYHVMLIDLVQPLVVGEQIEVSLEFANSEPQTVAVPVQAMGPMATGVDDQDDADEPGDADASDDMDGSDDDSEG
jgi:copper(I)-binding protein